jgi:hypothetical protein
VCVLGHSAIGRKVAVSSLDRVIELFKFTESLQPH